MFILNRIFTEGETLGKRIPYCSCRPVTSLGSGDTTMKTGMPLIVKL